MKIFKVTKPVCYSYLGPCGLDDNQEIEIGYFYDKADAESAGKYADMEYLDAQGDYGNCSIEYSPSVVEEIRIFSSIKEFIDNLE